MCLAAEVCTPQCGMKEDERKEKKYCSIHTFAGAFTSYAYEVVLLVEHMKHFGRRIVAR